MPPPDDELASAYLDGEATPEERARVEADPAVQARAAELGEVRRALATVPVAAGPAPREEAIAAALAAVPVRAPHRRHRVGLAVLGAAAAAAAVVVVVSLTRSDQSNGPQTARLGPAAVETTVAAAAPTAPPGTAAGAATTIASGGGSVASAAGSAPASAGAPFLGAVDDDAGVRALAATEDTAAVTAARGAAPAGACPMATGRLVGAVTWQGRAAWLYVTDDRQAVVVRADGCGTLAVVPLG